MLSRSIVASSLIVLSGSAAFAQPSVGGTIQDGPAIFSVLPGSNTGPLGNGAATSFSVNGPGGPNQLAAAWWWVRVDGQNTFRETALFQPDAQTTVSFPAGNQMRIVYNYGSFIAIMQWTVSGFANGFGALTQTVTVQSLDPVNALRFNLFNYNDVNVFGTAGNDTATQTGANTVQFTDGAFPIVRATYESSNALRQDVITNVRDLLTDNDIDNLSGGVINSGPGDLEIGSQFAFTLDPLSVQTVSSTLTIIPTPGALALMGLGGLAMFRRRRA